MNCSVCSAENVRTNPYLCGNTEVAVCEDCTDKVGENVVRLFKIPSPNWNTFVERFEKLTRRAVKLGCVVPTYTIIKEEPKEIAVSRTVVDEDGNGESDYVKRLIVVYSVVVNAPTVEIAGYEFSASMEHFAEGNVLHTLKDKSVPKKYRDADPNCDHCNLDRRRKETFILRHIDSNEYKQVGRQCLSDFIGGRNGETYAKIAELYSEFYDLSSASEESGGEGWGGGSKFEYLDRFLGYVAECIKLEGWRSATTAREHGGDSTANVAMLHMDPSPFDKNLMFKYPSAESVQVAKDAIAWCEALTDEQADNDYMHNIRVIAKRGIIGSKQFGYSASIVSTYQKMLGDLKRREYQKSNPSEYVGVVGERSKFKLNVNKVIAIDGAYGTVSIHIMRDDNNNAFVWKSSGEVFKVNEVVYLMGTVKEHKVYEKTGVKQTVLTRCKSMTEEEYNKPATVKGKRTKKEKTDAVVINLDDN